jgi:MFS family permease
VNKLFQNRWWVVFASILGLLVGSGSINMLSSAVFMKPMTEGLGIERGVFSYAVMLNAWMSGLSFPVLGWLLDRWGTRCIMIPGILICSLTTASYFFLPDSPGIWIYVLFAFAGFVYGCQSPVPYARVIAQWFDRERGLALGMIGIGSGLGSVLIPPFAALLIVKYGWRIAYVGLAGCVLVLGLLPVSIFLREGPGFSKRATHRQASSELPAPIGVEPAEAFKSREFWALTVAVFLAAVAIQGVSIHVVAMLTDRGVTIAVATAAYAAAGLTAVVGRFVCGWCLDRFSGPAVAIVFSSFAVMAVAVLLFARTGLEALVACLLLGMSTGAEFSILPLFVSRYFGLKNYGKIYGAIFAVFAVGVGLGIGLSGTAYDIFHGYRPILIFYEVLLAVSCLLYLLLGSYPYPGPKRMARIMPSTTVSRAQ